MRKADEKTIWQVVEAGDSTDHNRQKKVQLIPEKILSGSADTTAQASLPILLFRGHAKKKKKNHKKTPSKCHTELWSLYYNLKLCDFIPKLSFTDKISSLI